jgi:hypothetical protein
MTAAILVFTIPTAPKPLTYLAKQAGSSVSRLIGSNSSGSGGREPYATGSEQHGADVRQDIENRRNPAGIQKPRSAKKQWSVTSSARDEEASIEMGAVKPSTSK